MKNAFIFVFVLSLQSLTGFATTQNSGFQYRGSTLSHTQIVIYAVSPNGDLIAADYCSHQAFAAGEEHGVNSANAPYTHVVVANLDSQSYNIFVTQEVARILDAQSSRMNRQRAEANALANKNRIAERREKLGPYNPLSAQLVPAHIEAIIAYDQICAANRAAEAEEARAAYL